MSVHQSTFKHTDNKLLHNIICVLKLFKGNIKCWPTYIHFPFHLCTNKQGCYTSAQTPPAFRRWHNKYEEIKKALAQAGGLHQHCPPSVWIQRSVCVHVCMYWCVYSSVLCVPIGFILWRLLNWLTEGRKRRQNRRWKEGERESEKQRERWEDKEAETDQDR